MIPRRLLLAPPERLNPTVSPDGSMLAYLAPLDGVVNIWVAPLGDPGAARPVTNDQKRPIFECFWGFDSRHILYPQDVGGDENWHIYSVDVHGGQALDLTPFDGVSAYVHQRSRRFPDQILLAINQRDPVFHDLYRANITTGQLDLVLENDRFSSIAADHSLVPRLGFVTEDDGSDTCHRIDGQGDYSEVLRMPLEDCMSWRHFGFDHTGRFEYSSDCRGRDTAALIETDLETGARSTLAATNNSDVHEVLLSPLDGRVQAAAFSRSIREWQILDPTFERDFDTLRRVQAGEVSILSRSDDDRQWTVQYMIDDGPIRYYHYDRVMGEVAFLFSHRPDIEKLPLTKMQPIEIPARDEWSLPSYLTLPNASSADGNMRPDQPLPMVLLVHGGPWWRDVWGFNPLHQLLADRGYAVLSVNYRGSTGFGKSFINAADREWGGHMHDDLVDAVEWAVAEGIAIRDKVAIMGRSYGGYAALVGMTMTPDVFACGIAMVGISNLVTMLDSAPPYWRSWNSVMKVRVGDNATEEGQAFLLSRSPISYVDNIMNPLMLVHGANDVRCKRQESDQIVDAMQQRDIPVTYLVYPDEGHVLLRAENHMSSIVAAELFLAQHLGGQYEPIGDAFEGASAEIVCGGEFLT